MSKITVYPARRVVTMDPGRPSADAIAVLDGRVLSTGSLESMRPWFDHYDHEVDDRLRDKVILPGFIDPHTHLAKSSSYLAMNYVGPVDSPGPQGLNAGLPTREAVLAKLRDLDQAQPEPLSPLVAWGLDPAFQGGHLDRDALDAVSPDRPIWVISYAPHFAYVNSAALGRIGIDESNDAHGVLRDADGRLNGQFVELDAMRLALAGLNLDLGGRAGAAGLRRMGAIACAAGVTTTADMLFGLDDFDADWALHSDVVNDAQFPLRMALVCAEGPLFRTHGAGAAAAVKALEPRDSDKLFFRGIKFFADGSFPAMSLRLNFPGYLEGGNGLRNYIPWEELEARMRPFWDAGIKIHCHANGDEAIDAALDVLAGLQDARPRFDHRFTIEHYCISTPDQARRLKALGGLASVNSYFIHYRSQLHSQIGFGPDRSEAVARLGSLEREGVIFALHSDYSLVIVPMHPLTAAWTAVNRLALDGKTVVAPGERIGVDRALRAITIDAAYVLGMERRIGSLEPGKFADFAILEEDPYAVPPAALKDIRVWGTALAGRLHPA